MLKKLTVFFIGLLFSVTLFAKSSPSTYSGIVANQRKYRPWNVFVYYGKMTREVLGNVLVFHYSLSGTTLYSLEGGYTLAPENIISRIFNYVWADFGVALNLTYQDDPNGSIYEFNPFIRATWNRFPWNKYLYTAFSIGEGVSYVTQLPRQEVDSVRHAENPKRFLNFLMFELAFALPKYPQFQIVYRLHHRSGCYGLYEGTNTGSTAVGVGFRYSF